MKSQSALTEARNSRVRSRDILNRSQAEFTSTETSQSIVQMPNFNENESVNTSNVKIIARINAPISKQTQVAVITQKRSSSTASLRYANPIGSSSPYTMMIARPKHTNAAKPGMIL